MRKIKGREQKKRDGRSGCGKKWRNGRKRSRASWKEWMAGSMREVDDQRWNKKLKKNGGNDGQMYRRTGSCVEKEAKKRKK